MAQTIDKYVLETSVTGMKDVDALNTSVTTLGKSIDSVTSKKMALTLNATGFDELNNKIGNINTSLSTLATKTANPKVTLTGVDQLNAMISSLTSSINQLGGKVLNINTDSDQVNAAKRDVDRLGNAIDGVDRKNINVKAEVGGGILGQNIDELKNSLSSLSTGLLTGAIAAIAALGTSSITSAGDLTDLANASDFTTGELVSLRDSIRDAGGSSDDATKFVNKLMEAINSAADGSDSAIQIFKDLNVPIKDINGEMRNTPTIAADVITSLGKMTDKTKSQKLATELFGRSLKNLDYSQIKFANDVTLTNQIKKTDDVGAAWDKLSGAFSRSGFKAVASSANTLADNLDALTSITNDLFSVFDVAPSKADGAKSFFSEIYDAVFPLSIILPKTKKVMDDLINWSSGGVGRKIQGGEPILNAAGVEMPDIRAKRYANEAENMKNYVPRDSYKPEPIDPSRFGTSKSASDKAASEAKAAADKAKAEQEARDRARQAMDAEMTALKAASKMKLEAIQQEGTLLGLSSRAASENRAAIEIQNNLKRDYQKIDAEILQEKQKGAKADQYIIDKLKEQKTIVNLLASDLLDQVTANSEVSKGIEEKNRLLKAQYDAVVGISKLESSDVKTAAIQKEIDKHNEALDQYKAQYDALVAIGQEQGLLSQAYLTAAENFSAYNEIWMLGMDNQRLKIEELRQAEKERSESFAGGWEDAMRRMVDSFTPAQNGAKAFNDLWGNIETSISSSISTGRFEFAKFRDAVIADIAAMMFKAAAANLIGKILGTVVNAAVAPASTGGNAAQGLKLPRAGGGSVSGGQPYMVGERGPELFMPGENGTIIPNRNLTAETKPTQVVNNYYNVSAVDGQSVARFFLDNRNMVAAANRQASKERN